MITENKLLIDKNCPMCNLYGQCFTKYNFIDNESVSSYQEVDDTVFNQIDQERAKYEIAMFDVNTGKTIYGIDVMIKIITSGSKRLNRFLNSTVIYYLVSRLYRFISYNRSVIYSLNSTAYSRDCTPPLNVKYRWMYLMFSVLLTGLIVNQFTLHLDAKLGWNHLPYREYIICLGQLVWQFIAISFIAVEKRLDYLGNMSTVSIIGSLLLLPLVTLDYFVDLDWMIYMGGFGLIVSTMLFIHIKRCKEMKLPLFMSVSWISYRLTILLVILITSI